MSDTAEAKYKYDKTLRKLSRAPQGRRLGDERLEVLIVLEALVGAGSRGRGLRTGLGQQERGSGFGFGFSPHGLGCFGFWVS